MLGGAIMPTLQWDAIFMEMTLRRQCHAKSMVKLGVKCDCILMQVSWDHVIKNKVPPHLRSHFLCVVLETGFIR